MNQFTASTALLLSMLAGAASAQTGNAAACARLEQASPAATPAPAARTAAAAALLAALPPLNAPQARRLRAAVGDEVAWWLNKQGAVNLATVPTAFHEANHAIDIGLSDCHGGKAVFVFEGETYATEMTRGSTAPYVVAASAVPAAFRQRSPRYQTYLLGTPKKAANDFTTLLDEFNAYVGAAQMELELARTPLYSRFRAEGNAALDGNIGGAADMMLFVLSYLKVTRTRYPDSYAKIGNSPLLLAHLQRLWTAAEAMLDAAAPYSSEKGGLYVYPIAALVAVRSPAFSGELDRLKIRHKQ